MTPRSSQAVDAPKVARKVIAYQLSLLDEPPKPGFAWRRGFWQWWLGGCAFPVSEDAKRQATLLTSETHSFDADGAARQVATVGPAVYPELVE